jgi:hypothetical protein
LRKSAAFHAKALGIQQDGRLSKATSDFRLCQFNIQSVNQYCFVNGRADKLKMSSATACLRQAFLTSLMLSVE